MIIEKIVKTLEMQYLPQLFYEEPDLFQTVVGTPDLLYHYIEVQLSKQGMKMPYAPSDFRLTKATIGTNDPDMKTINGYWFFYPTKASLGLLCSQFFFENMGNSFRCAYGVQVEKTKAQIRTWEKLYGGGDTTFLKPPYFGWSLVKFCQNQTVQKIRKTNVVKLNTILPVFLNDYVQSAYAYYRVK